MNLPDYAFLSAPLWLVTLLHWATLTLHFICMNFFVGGIILVLFGGFGDRWNNPTVMKFVKLFPSAMAATVSFGVAPLLFVQLVYPKQVYSASIVSGWLWLLIIAVLIAAYYFLYGSAFAKESARSRIGTYLAIALLGFVYVSFVYSSVFSLAERPDLYQLLYSGHQSGMIVNPDIGTYIFRWLHMIVGAITVGAFFVGWIGRDDEVAYRVGKRFYLYGMIVGMILGLVYLFTLGEYLVPLMRHPAIWLLLVGIILSLASLHFFFKKKFLSAGLMLVVSLVTMVILRHSLRLILLNGFFDPATIPVRPQWSIFIIFLVMFVVALALIWYMFKLFFAGAEKKA
jgi:hypothetical protein